MILMMMMTMGEEKHDSFEQTLLSTFVVTALRTVTRRVALFLLASQSESGHVCYPPGEVVRSHQQAITTSTQHAESAACPKETQSHINKAKDQVRGC